MALVNITQVAQDAANPDGAYITGTVNGKSYTIRVWKSGLQGMTRPQQQAAVAKALKAAFDSDQSNQQADGANPLLAQNIDIP
jgi:stress-induced morphogen